MKLNYLKDWYFTKTITGAVQMHGTIYNDAKKRFEDGTRISTSRVLIADLVNGVVQTKNTTYNLDLGVYEYDKN